MTTKKKILVFTATYNERDNIERLIKSILSNYRNNTFGVITACVNPSL